MNDNIAIKVDGVSKAFRLPHEKSGSIKSALLGWRKRKKGYENQQVLKEVSFEIKKGEFYGIVGRNGSGKSTLLKLISQIYTPDSGSITVNGKLTPFIELGVGFNPELSGRDNVYLNGALLGFNREEMDAMYDEIVEFAELERFMDQKLKNYSSGMQVRLAFSIAIRADTDILVLDEVLAVGDEAFQKKCFEYFAKLKKNKKTVILVTHSMDSVQQFCTKALLIDKGHDTVEGSPSEIANIYRELNSDLSSRKESFSGGGEYVDVDVKCKKHKKTVNLELSILPKTNFADAIVTVFITKQDAAVVYRWASDDKEKIGIDFSSNQKKTVKLEIDNIFPNGSYAVRVVIKKRDRTKDYGVFNDVGRFEIIESDPHWQLHQKVTISN